MDDENGYLLKIMDIWLYGYIRIPKSTVFLVKG